MKKFIAVILIILFAANISGASISYHFCGKIFRYMAFGGAKKKCCCLGKKPMKDCCKTKHCKVSIDDNKSFAQPIKLSLKYIIHAVIEQQSLLVQGQRLKHFEVVFDIPFPNGPPVPSKVPIHILHQQFLI